MGLTDKLAGRAKEVAGDVTDDPKTREQGRKQKRKASRQYR